MNKQSLFVLFIVIGVAVAALDRFVVPADDGAILIALTFWTMVAQGCIAIVAVAEVAKGVWLIPVRRDLLAANPMLLFLALLYVLLGLRTGELYAWAEHPTVWLTEQFFFIRNIVLLLLCFVVGRMLSGAIMKGSAKSSALGVLYVFVWTTSQTLIAFDWIMSLEYPWISTLLGAFFFIQSLLMGLITAMYILSFRKASGEQGLTETLRDTAKMMFAFCFMWAGFFFAQYLVIWYGNIPEEVDYLAKRSGTGSPYWMLSRAVLAMIFAIPFVTLLFRKAKVTLPIIMTIGAIILVGIVLELYLLVAPVVPVSKLWLTGELLLILIAFAALMRSRKSFMPEEVRAAGDDKGGAAGDLAAVHRAP